MGYRQLLKDIVEEQANQDYIVNEGIKHLYPRAKTQTTDNGIQCMRYLFDEHDMRLTEDGTRVLPEWLRKKRCINALDTFDDNLCVWRCLALYKRKDVKRGAERSTKEALKLAREFYSDNKLKRKDVRATKLVDFEGIAKHLNVNIMLYESEKESGEDASKIWKLVYGKTQYKNTLPTINMGLFKGHCFYINKIDVLCQNWNAKDARKSLSKAII